VSRALTEEADLAVLANPDVDPNPLYERLRDEAPVLHHEATNVWLISRHGDIASLIDKWGPATVVRQLQFLPPAGSDFDLARQTTERRVLASAFGAINLAEQRARVRTYVRDALKQISEVPSCEFVTDVARSLSVLLIGDLIGLDRTDVDTMCGWADALIVGAVAGEAGYLHGRDPGVPSAPAKDAHEHLEERIYEAIAERRRNPRDDYLSALVKGSNRGEKLSDGDIAKELVTFFVGGNETFRNLLVGSIQTLAGRPDVQRELFSRDGGVDDVALDELFRWVTPIPNLLRSATADIELHGHKIPCGATLMLLLLSANRDPRVFAEPNHFDLNRRPNPHLSTGIGPFSCLGFRLSRMQLQVTITEFATMFEEFSMNGPPPETIPSLFIRAPRSLPLNLRRRSS
jgi:cytochrome P450 family 142 subfamily A polypeptide 1